ncbi:MAG: GNAT family N-acetyltransferase [Oscillospiraceae bacterium]|nr:GNAT family N-acetyltransferase [Oscillospiraceae bacterium]
MEAKIITTEQGFLSLKDSWTALLERMHDATPFQTWEWNYYFWKYHPEELMIIIAVQNKYVYGIAPLVKRNGIIEFIGDKHFDYGEMICAEKKSDVFDVIFDEIDAQCKKDGFTYWLKNIPVWSSQYVLFRERARSCKRVLCRELVSTAGIYLSEYGTFDRYLMSISASLRKKSIKPCQNAGVQYSIEPFSEPLWSSIEQIYEARMEDRIGVSKLDWAKEIVRELSNLGLLRIGMLRYREEYIAFTIYYCFGKKICIWLTAFKTMEGYGFGNYLRYCLIRSAFENGVETVDLMRGAYDYKKQWDANISYNVEIRSFRIPVYKTLYSIKMYLRSFLRDIVYGNSLFKSIYQRLSKVKK